MYSENGYKWCNRQAWIGYEWVGTDEGEDEGSRQNGLVKGKQFWVAGGDERLSGETEYHGQRPPYLGLTQEPILLGLVPIFSLMEERLVFVIRLANLDAERY